MNTMHQKIPAAWLTILTDIRTIASAVPILGGGALRDTYLGRPVKDLDIFLPFDPIAQEALTEFYQVLGYDLIPNDRDYLQNLGPEGEVHTVTTLRHPEQVELNIIFLNPAREHSLASVMGRFDFGICQIVGAISGGIFNILTTTAFVQDTLAKTFTLLRADPHGRSQARFDRLAVKYKGFTFVDGTTAQFLPAPAPAPVSRKKKAS